jgi:hypothetical protein
MGDEKVVLSGVINTRGQSRVITVLLSLIAQCEVVRVLRAENTQYSRTDQIQIGVFPTDIRDTKLL